jgi:hypothetical protein
MANLLPLSNGGVLDMDNLPQQPTFEMLEACVKRIRALEASAAEHEGTGYVSTPRKRARSEATSSDKKGTKKKTPDTPPGSQPLAAATAKSLVRDIKSKLKATKFSPGSHAESRLVRITAARFPQEEAIAMLGVDEDGKPKSKTLEGEDISQMLRLKRGELKGNLYWKHRHYFCNDFEAIKSKYI